MSRVAITAFEATPRTATEAGLAWQWSSAYRALGHDVTVFTQSSVTVDQRLDWLNAGVNIVEIAGESAPRTASGMLGLISSRRLYGAWSRAVQGRVVRENFDIIHHVSWGSVRLRPPFAKLKDPTVRTIWGPLGGGHHARFLGIRPREWTAEIARSLTFLLVGSYRWARRSGRNSQVLVTNEETRLFLARRRVTSTPMLADGVPTGYLAETPRNLLPRPLRLLWTGRMVGTKRPDLAIRVLLRLRSQGLPVELTLVGDGPERGKLGRLAATLGVKAHVTFSGTVDWSEMQAVYDEHDILLFHSMRDSSCPAVLEAAARGVPSVALRIQGVGSAVPNEVARGPRAFSCTRELVDALTSACIELSEAKAYEEASRAALAFAREETWQAKVSRLVA